MYIMLNNSSRTCHSKQNSAALHTTPLPPSRLCFSFSVDLWSILEHAPSSWKLCIHPCSSSGMHEKLHWEGGGGSDLRLYSREANRHCMPCKYMAMYFE